MKTNILATVGTFILGFAISVCAEAQENRWLTEDICNIAHRGGALEGPEETIEAMLIAIDNGACALEADFQLTLDNKLVLMHDEDVDRTTNGSGDIRDMTLAEIQALDAGYHFTTDGGRTYPFRGRGVRVPELRDLLEFVRDEDIPLMLEFKGDIDQVGAVYQAFIMIDEMRIGHLINFATLEQDVMEEIRTLAYGNYPGRRSGHLQRIGGPRNVITSLTVGETMSFLFRSTRHLRDNRGWTDSQGNLKAPAEYVVIPTCEAYVHIWTEQFNLGRVARWMLRNILGAFSGGSRSERSARRYVDKAERFGLSTGTYTINDPENMRFLRDCGIVGIITDSVSDLSDVLNP